MVMLNSDIPMESDTLLLLCTVAFMRPPPLSTYALLALSLNVECHVSFLLVVSQRFFILRIILEFQVFLYQLMLLIVYRFLSYHSSIRNVLWSLLHFLLRSLQLFLLIRFPVLNLTLYFGIGISVISVWMLPRLP